MKALRLVLRAPRLIAVLVLLQLVVTTYLANRLGDAVAVSLGAPSPAPEDHIQGVVSELFAIHPSLLLLFRQGLGNSAGFGALMWLLLAPVIILRLRGPMPRLLPAAFASLPGVVVTTFWSWIPRAVLLALAGLAANAAMDHGWWGFVALLGVAAVHAYSACALDLARCAVVLHGARRYHPGTALAGYSQALRRPRVLLPSMLASFAQWACAVATAALAVHGLTTGATVWWIRLLAALGVVFGLLRVAVAVSAGRYRDAS